MIANGIPHIKKISLGKLFAVTYFCMKLGRHFTMTFIVFLFKLRNSINNVWIIFWCTVIVAYGLMLETQKKIWSHLSLEHKELNSSLCSSMKIFKSSGIASTLSLL